MTVVAKILKSIVTALCLTIVLGAPVSSQGADIEQLFTDLARPETRDWQRIEQEIWGYWSKSGSDAMDLLLERGRDALQAGDIDGAIEHFTALTDHAPEFAEGWNSRATAYFQAGLYGPSLGDIRRTLALNPRHFGAMSGLGMVLEQLDQPARALFAYRQVQAIHPHRPDLEDTIRRLEKQVSGTSL